MPWRSGQPSAGVGSSRSASPGSRAPWSCSTSPLPPRRSAGRSGARTSDLLLAGTGAGALATIPAALVQGAPWSPTCAVALGLGIGVAMMALGYGLWTRAMAHPAGACLAPAAYAGPLLSTCLLLLTGHRLSPLGLGALIVLCAAAVILDALPRRRPSSLPCNRRFRAFFPP